MYMCTQNKVGRNILGTLVMNRMCKKVGSWSWQIFSRQPLDLPDFQPFLPQTLHHVPRANLVDLCASEGTPPCHLRISAPFANKILRDMMIGVALEGESKKKKKEKKFHPV